MIAAAGTYAVPAELLEFRDAIRQIVTERVARGRQVRACVREGCDYKQEEEITVA